MSRNTLNKLIDLRKLRAARAQSLLSKAISDRNVIEENTKKLYAEMHSYRKERPNMEWAVFSTFKNSKCGASAIEDYRHGMRSCEAEDARLTLTHNESLVQLREAIQNVESARNAFMMIRKNVEKLNIFQSISINNREQEQLKDENEGIDE